MSEADSVEAIVADLYALDPGDFVAARDKAAADLRAGGDKAAAAAVKKLGRPTTAAWALNQLVRANPELVDRVAALGERLRQAQGSLDAAALKTLRPERDSLLEEAGHAAATVAAARGHSLESAADEVRATLVAALADEAAADAVLSGRLVRALSYAGFGEVELADAVASLPGPKAEGEGQAEPKMGSKSRHKPEGAAQKAEPAGRTRAKATRSPSQGGGTGSTRKRQGEDTERERREAVERARRAVQSAERALHSAEEEATAAGLAEARAQAQVGSAARRLEEFRQLVAKAERTHAAAEAERDEAAADRADADRRVEAATAAWSQAQEALAELETS